MLTPTILRGALAALALTLIVGTGTTAAHATETEPDVITTTTAPAATEVEISLGHAKLGLLQNVSIPQRSCPADAPYLNDIEYHPGSGWRIPRGLEVRGYTGAYGLDVHVDPIANRTIGSEGYAGGGVSSAMNWGIPVHDVHFIMHCTSEDIPNIAKVTWTRFFKPYEEEKFISVHCPADRPFLVNQSSTFGGIGNSQYFLVKGVNVDVQDSGAAGNNPRVAAVALNRNGWQGGVQDMAFTNEFDNSKLTLTLSCVDDIRYAAPF